MNYMPDAGEGFAAYAVILREVFFNTSTQTMHEYTNFTENPIINASYVNFTMSGAWGPGVMRAVQPGSTGGVHTNAFIPKNSSGDLELSLCAEMLKDMYLWLFNDTGNYGSGINIVVDPVARSIYLTGTKHGYYANMIYYANGTLQTGEMRVTFDGTKITRINYTRIFDFNPIDNTNWNVNPGDVWYYGVNHDEVRLEVLNETIRLWDVPGFNGVVKEIWANATVWNATLQMWLPMGEVIIGMSNDRWDFVRIPLPHIVPILLPQNFDMSVVAEFWELGNGNDPTYDTVTFGPNWVRMENVSTGGHLYYEYLPDGRLKYAYSLNIPYLFGGNETVIYLKNSTILPAGPASFEILPLGTIDFAIEFNLSVSADTQIFYAGFNENPINVSLNNGRIFFDIMVNDTGNLDALINITIEYNVSQYENIEVVWFNTTSNQWESIPFVDLGNGTITISIDHLSIFGLQGTDVVDDGSTSSNGGDEPPGAIPGFNIFYLMLTILGATIIIVMMKKKKLY